MSSPEEVFNSSKDLHKVTKLGNNLRICSLAA